MRSTVFLFLVLLTIVFLAFTASAQPDIKFERARHREMLDVIRQEIQKNYYDPAFHGIKLEERFGAADEKLKQTTSIGQMSAIIAQVLIDFDDSHLFFLPPGKANKTEYGFRIQMIGDKCFVTEVKPKSNAEAQGLKPGDEIYSIDGFAPLRENLWKMNYYYNILRPRPLLKLVVIKPDKKEVELQIEAKITEGRLVRGTVYTDTADYWKDIDDARLKAKKQYYYEKIPGLIIWKMTGFSVSPAEADEIMDKVRKYDSLILDLRNNGGGRVDMQERLIGNFFPRDVKIGVSKWRKKTQDEVAKSRKDDTYNGKVVILIDSNSASSSEVFARVMQLEKRGKVLGDNSAGAVMTSIRYDYSVGLDVVAYYGASVTVADLIMTDGKSLEKIGVTPDEKILPSNLDLAARRDPVLARAAELLGYKLTPDEAGKIFQLPWEDNNY